MRAIYTDGGESDLSVMRVESILVIAILLALLLQLPRVDEARPPLSIGGLLSRVSSIEGAAVYVDLGANGVALVDVSEIRMHRDPSGNTYVTLLEGDHIGGGGGVRGVRIDTTERAEELGWRPVNRMDGLVFSGPGGEYEFGELRFQKLLHEGVVLLAVGSIEGIDLTTGRVISEEYAPGVDVCPSVPVIGCAGAVGTRNGCLSVERGGWVTGCRCLQGEDCFWTVTGTACWDAACKGSCRGTPGWSAGCRCD